MRSKRDRLCFSFPWVDAGFLEKAERPDVILKLLLYQESLRFYGDCDNWPG